MTFPKICLILLLSIWPTFIYAVEAETKDKDQAEILLADKIAQLEARIKQLETNQKKDSKRLDNVSKEGKAGVSVGNYIKLYGRLRLDYSFDTSRCLGGASWGFWVLPNYDGVIGVEPNKRNFENNNDFESNISARNSRFGFKLKGTDIKIIAAKLSGIFEIDFNGGDININTWKAYPRLRLAAFVLDWGFVELMAGNHWDTFSARIFPASDSNIAGAYNGSIGYRRPQIRLTFKPKISKNGRLYIQFAIARPLDITKADLDGDGNNDGEDSMIPQLQGRIAIETPLWTNDLFILGIGGHFQRGHTNLKVGKNQIDKYDSWHIDAELQFPIIDELLLKGEFFYGVMLADMVGGIGQDFNPATLEGIKTMGGWVELYAKPFKVWHIAAGYQEERPDDSTMKVDTAAELEGLRFKNASIYLTNIFNLGSGFVMELNYTHMMTKYRLSIDGKTANRYKSYLARNNRLLITATYNF